MEAAEPKILFENDVVLVIDKPAGLSVHGDGRNEGWTLADWILRERPEMEGVGEPTELSDGNVIKRPGIVHRLDKDTSGVMVLAKTQDMYLFLKRQFKAHEVRKRYHAFVYGSPRDDRGTIDTPIGRSASDVRKRATGRGIRGEIREAMTRWRIIARGKGCSMIEAIPVTGRTHQIRIHMRSIGHPVLNDRLYAPGRPLMLGMDRLALHARAIIFRLPGGTEKTVESQYPEDFRRAEEAFRRA